MRSSLRQMSMYCIECSVLSGDALVEPTQQQRGLVPPQDESVGLALVRIDNGHRLGWLSPHEK
jgi:hypothetical protein